MTPLKHEISVLAVFCIVLLIVTSGCIGNNKSKVGFGNASIGKPTEVTTVPTGTETPETTGTTEDTDPWVVTPTVDLSCLGTKNCGLGPMCYNNCLKNADQPLHPTQKEYDTCDRLCCNSYCMDMPAGSSEQKACGKVCEKKLAGFVKTPTPTKTLRPPNIDW
jgi:hypothetical protein